MGYRDQDRTGTFSAWDLVAKPLGPHRPGQPMKVGGAVYEAFAACRDTMAFYACLFYFLSGGTLRDCKFFKDRQQARVQLYSLALVFYLWDRDHYRSGTFQQDMVKNLRNVAIPGTGVSLRWVCYFRITAYIFLFVFYPVIAAVSAVNFAVQAGSIASFFARYRVQLLMPPDWFSFWRLNCRLASHHAGISHDSGYSVEDKWTFLQTAEKEGIAVTPTLQCAGIVCKHRNEEGGLGYASFGNARSGGDWIIQERLSNAPALARLLPDNAPLSTLRIITSSRGGLSPSLAETEASGQKPSPPVPISDVQALSCVFRAGRAGAITDHVAIFFDVDMKTGVIQKGTTNAHWYQLGLSTIFETPWLSSHTIVEHPDTGRAVAGETIPNMNAIVDLVRSAHHRMAPRVPMIGWDVALTQEAGMCLLEGNLSCNFFRGTFDQPAYFSFIEEYFVSLEDRMSLAKDSAHGAAAPAPSTDTADTVFPEHAHRRFSTSSSSRSNLR